MQGRIQPNLEICLPTNALKSCLSFTTHEETLAAKFFNAFLAAFAATATFLNAATYWFISVRLCVAAF